MTKADLINALAEDTELNPLNKVCFPRLALV